MSIFIKLRQKYKLLIFIIINVCLLLYLFKADYMIVPDSSTYINNHIIRTPSYPLFLDLFQFIFGSGYLSMVVYCQIFLTFIASFILINSLQKYVGFGEYIFLLLYLILLYPLYSELNLSNKILPDSLAYICFILIIKYLVVYIFERKKIYLIIFLALSALTTTIRPQFVFLYGIDLLVIFYHIYRSKNVRLGSVLVLIFFVLVFLPSIFQKTYNYIYHGSFSKLPFSGIQLVIPQLYLSDKEDLKIFQYLPEDQRIFLEKVYSEIEEKRLNSKWKDISIPLAAHYTGAFNEICWRVVAKTYFKNEELSKVTPQQFIDIDSLTMTVTLKLLPIHYMRFIKLYISNIIAGIGFTGSFFLSYFIIVFLILFINTKNEFHFLLLIIYITVLANYMLIAMFEPVMKRYTFYTDMMYIVFTIIFLLIYVRDSRLIFFQKQSAGTGNYC